MATNRLKGKLVIWEDDNGFGYITPENSTEDIFVHIFAFGKNISRRPKIGDTVYFAVHTDKNGKNKAIDGVIEGVKRRSNTRTKKYLGKSEPKSSWRTFGRILIFFAVLLAGFGSSFSGRLQYDLDRLFSSGKQLSDGFKNISNTGQRSSRLSCQKSPLDKHVPSVEKAASPLAECGGTDADGDGGPSRK